MDYFIDCYILHSTISKSTDGTFVLFDSTQVLSVLNYSDEELEEQMVSEYFGRVRTERDSLAQKCFVDAADEEIPKICNQLV